MTFDAEKEEGRKYRRVWADERYRVNSPAERSGAKRFIKAFPEASGTVTDYGCGTGRAAKLFLKAGLDVVPVDIASNALDDDMREMIGDKFVKACLWNLPSAVGASEYAFCCDVLEHLPEDKIDFALAHISARCKVGGLIQVYTKPENFGQLIGYDNLHLTVKDAGWWLEKIGAAFEVLDQKELDDSVVIIVGQGKLYNKMIVE